MKIKICGITTLEDARFCAAAGADFLGFVLYESSPRRISADEAAAVIEWIHGPETVGVFVNQDADTVNRTAERAGFGLVQLHGDETPDECAAVERPVIKAIGVRPGTTAEDLAAEIDRYADVADYLLLDSRVDGLHGGTGRPFDWTIAETAAAGTPIILAGGLDPDNVAEAARRIRPYGVDVATGVESEPGRKDFDRVQAFFDALSPFREA